MYPTATEEEGDSDVSNTSATPQSGAVVGHKFFGPDFSLDAFKSTCLFLLLSTNLFLSDDSRLFSQ